MEIQDSLSFHLGVPCVQCSPPTCQSTLQVELAEPIVEPLVPHGENPKQKVHRNMTPKWVMSTNTYGEPLTINSMWQET
jgi:hypothetical protein